MIIYFSREYEEKTRLEFIRELRVYIISNF